mgnify:CR=1 FL=1
MMQNFLIGIAIGHFGYLYIMGRLPESTKPMSILSLIALIIAIFL